MRVRSLVEGRNDADRAPSGEERHPERRTGTDLAGDVLLDLRIVENRIDACAAGGTEDTSSFRFEDIGLEPEQGPRLRLH